MASAAKVPIDFIDSALKTEFRDLGEVCFPLPRHAESPMRDSAATAADD
jgi:hypothetical protein